MSIQQPVFSKTRSEVPPDARVIDFVEGGLRELFFIQNPQFKKEMPTAAEPLKEFLSTQKNEGVWIYLPWNNEAIHCLPEELYYKLRTARNRNIINDTEQTNYRNLSVGIAGLSVGSAILSALVVSGGPKRLKIADFDTIEISNLNRIHAKITDLGANKAEVAARNVWGLDPFAELSVWSSGVSKENIEDFITGSPKLDIFIDEMDSIDLKIISRLVCKKLKVPVLMATDNGDGIILDVERFDLEPDRKIFHGLVQNEIDENSPSDFANLDFKKWLKLATMIVHPDFLTEKMIDSIPQIGKVISAIPQLGTSASVAGAATSFVVRRIANKQDMPSGRYTLNFEEAFIPGYKSPDSIKNREEKKKKFMEIFK
ncbi:MAG: ThiF family adenylyltransferase [Patescibacteria group bacterium]